MTTTRSRSWRRAATSSHGPTSPTTSTAQPILGWSSSTTIAGQGKTPLAKNFNAAFNDPQSPWIQLFRAAVFDDADDATIDQLNAGITSVLQG